MTQQRILELAYYKALDNWAKANERAAVASRPFAARAKETEKMAHDELMEVSRLLWEAEHLRKKNINNKIQSDKERKI